MSKTFASRPTVNRPARGRGASTRNTGRDGSEESSTQPSSSSLRGRGVQLQGGGGGGPVTRSRSNSSRSSPTNKTTSTSTRKMYPSGNNHGPGRGHQEETSQGASQQGEHCGGYTVFQPNVRKRQQINEMAQREKAAFDRFKEERKPRNLNYVGTAGGDVPEHVVRNQQHHDNRFQKLRRQQRQEETRLAKREAEDRKIETMRKEARRKADENELSGKTADPEDLRRLSEVGRLIQHKMEKRSLLTTL